jgi:ribonuclease BN (tRNA processing enzyme)
VTGPSDMPKVLTTDPDAFTAMVATAGDHRFGPLTVRLAQVEHGECWATRIGDALCYTADTAPCNALDELADGCAVLLAEASGLDGNGPLKGHLTAGDAARLAVRSGAELLILTHLRPWQDHLALLAEAAQIAYCPVILAHPGLRVALRDQPQG